MGLRVVPEGLTAASAAVQALTARLASAQGDAAPLVTAVVPPAAYPVSLQTAAGQTQWNQAMSELVRAYHAMAGTHQTNTTAMRARDQAEAGKWGG
ncbi:MAG: PE domain-containing protein [Mycobacterium sp.]|uniref:PE family protein n=1 Tax=Mycobacterium sp. TaxID=1785 RepID=UPI003CC63FDF